VHQQSSLIQGPLNRVGDIGALRTEVFGDSNLVVQQINGESQCFDGRLNEYREECLRLLNQLEEFSVGYIPQEENTKANILAQQASSYDVH
jgi:ribonuclease HI